MKCTKCGEAIKKGDIAIRIEALKMDSDVSYNQTVISGVYHVACAIIVVDEIKQAG